jgi:N-acetyl-alpha-D-muramate 1-phosphate uridylyltransferase
VEVAGHPFLHHQLTLLKHHGISEVVVCTGHLGHLIEEFAGDGSRWHLHVRYSHDGDRPLGTGGALKKALPLLSDPFYVLYGDSYLEAPLPLPSHQYVMTVLKNEGRWDRSNVEFKQGRIQAYDKAGPGHAMQHIDYGLGLLHKAALAEEKAEAFDLADFYGRLVREKRLEGHEVTRRFYEIGSPKGLQETRDYLGSK